MIKLENYKIIKKIASGGMGDVYLAVHTVLETKVAIKSLHSNLVNDEDFRKRFRTEARTQSKLSHPNIVKLIDFQERKDGLYLIMEYVEGKQLNYYIRDDTGPVPAHKLIPLFKEILLAIQHAHSKGLIHRDIKPSNILITTEGNAKIIDFGIAKSSNEDKGLTKTGVQVGTVSYMSPEQVNAEKLDKLTDIYSLGVVLFQMAVGKAPYSAQTNTFKIQLSIVSEPLPDPKEIYPPISDYLVAIIDKATQKKKEDRYQSCEEFIKSFDKKVVSKKIKSKPINSTNNPLEVSKKTVNKKNNKTKSSLIVYLIAGIFLTAVITFFIEQNRVQEKLKQEKLDMLVQDRLDKIEDERLAKLEKERLAKLEEERLAKLRVNNTNNSNNRFNNNNSINTKEYNNGTYIGNFKNNLRHGKGKYSWTDGDIYDGYWVDGDQTGKGKYTWSNGDIYEGAFINDVRTGKGKYTWKESGDIYEGAFLNGVRTGKGKYYWKESGNNYVGDFLNSQRTGKAKYTWKKSGDIYEGDFINGVITGKGKYTWKESGNIYEGDFLDSQRTGKGKYTWKESGDIYEGDFINAAKSGKGKYTYKNSGDVYEGDFVNLDFTGKGKYTWRNGDVFVGDFNKDVKGKGRMYFKSSGKREFGEYNKRGKWKKR